MEKVLNSNLYEKLFKFNLQMNDSLLNSSDFGNTLTNLVSDFWGYKNSVIIFAENKFINIYDNVNLKKLYSKEYIDKDIKNEYIMKNKSLFDFSSSDNSPKILYLEDIISFVDYEQTEFYNNFFKQQNIFYECIILFDESTSSLSLYKSKQDGNFTEDERSVITYISDVARHGYML